MSIPDGGPPLACSRVLRPGIVHPSIGATLSKQVIVNTASTANSARSKHFIHDQSIMCMIFIRDQSNASIRSGLCISEDRQCEIQLKQKYLIM
jgi:hypothetical protein